MLNKGVLLGRKATDYIAGTLPYSEILPNGDWTGYCPPGEWQRPNLVDTMACVTFSALNCIETQEKQQTGLQVNYSDRWIAKMSGTTPQGNYLYKVVDAIRQYGLVLEEDYPAPANFTWDEYYADINPDLMDNLLAKGQIWLNKWAVNYEWLQVNDLNIDHHLKRSPVQVVIPGHAVEGIYSPQLMIEYFDSYEPFFKGTVISNLVDALAIVLTRKEKMPTRFFIKDGAKIGAFVADGFALGGAFAKDAGALESLKSALEFKGDEPTLELPPSANP